MEAMGSKNYIRDSIFSEVSIKNDVYLLRLNETIGLYTIDIYKILPIEILQKILEEKIILGIEHSIESNFKLIDVVYDIFVKKLNINPKQILLIVSSFDFKDYLTVYSKNVCKMEFYSCCERIMQQKLKNITCNPLTNNNPKKKFICFNRNTTSHKVCLLKLLSKKDLIKFSYYSFPLKNDTKTKLDTVDYFYSKLKNHLDDSEKVIKSLPLIIDTEKILEENHAWKSELHLQSFYQESYFSVVTETNFNNNTPRFLTEKIFKAILHKHPFIVVSNPYTLQHLRDLGYKTFHGIIDETYDTLIDDSERLLYVVNEIERLCNLSTNELILFQKKCLEIVEYNYNILRNKKNFIKKLI